MSGTKFLRVTTLIQPPVYTDSPHGPPTRPRPLTQPYASCPTFHRFSDKRLRDELFTKNISPARTTRRISARLFLVFFPSKSFKDIGFAFHYRTFSRACQVIFSAKTAQKTHWPAFHTGLRATNKNRCVCACTTPSLSKICCALHKRSQQDCTENPGNSHSIMWANHTSAPTS